MDTEIQTISSVEDIKNRVYWFRGKQVMLDVDLAILYGYEVKNLNRQVKRNIDRFPEDFMFQLTNNEFDELRCQNVTAISNMSRTMPYAFTEQGIYMLATVLKGELAQQQSIFIMRAFREMRHFIANNALLFEKINAMELKQLSKIYDKIDEAENLLVGAKAKKRSIMADKISGDNIYKTLIFFDKVNDTLNEAERREFFTQIIERIEIYEEEQENGQWLKSVEFKLPIIPHDMNLRLDSGSHTETVVLLSKGMVDKDKFRKVKVDFSLEDMDLKELCGKATYAQIHDYVLEQTGLNVSRLYIAQIKRKCGFEVGENHNLPKSEDARQPKCPPEKEKAIMQAFRYYGII